MELLDDVGDRAAQRELHLLALGDVLVERVAATLDREPGGGRRARGHAAVDLEQLAAPADDVAGALVAPGEAGCPPSRCSHRRPSPSRRDPARRIPPSAISGTPSCRAASAHSSTAESWGTPTPATSRVVHAKPGPIPTLTASAPAAARSVTPSPVATLPATTSTSGQALFSSRDGFDRSVGVAVGDVEHECVDLGRDELARPIEIVTADPDRGRDPEAAQPYRASPAGSDRRPRDRGA